MYVVDDLIRILNSYYLIPYKIFHFTLQKNNKMLFKNCVKIKKKQKFN